MDTTMATRENLKLRINVFYNLETLLSCIEKQGKNRRKRRHLRVQTSKKSKLLEIKEKEDLKKDIYAGD